MAIKQKIETRPDRQRLLLAGGIALFALLLLGSIEFSSQPREAHSGDRRQAARTASSELGAEWQAQAESAPGEFLELMARR